MRYDPSKIRNHYFSFRKSVKFFYLLLIFSTFFTIFVTSFFYSVTKPIFWIFSGIIFSFSMLQAMIFWRLSKTQIDLNKVIFGISNRVFPPNMPVPKDEKYEKTGFSEVLKFIYELDTSQNSLPQSPNQSIPEIINNPQVTLNVLDSQNKIIFKNSSTIDFSNIQKNKLTEILDWIEVARDSKIRDSKVWERIFIESKKTHEKQLFDVAVFFDKQFECDTVLYLIDKNNNYADDENDLNFIAFAAHEIRGPITIIRGYLDILKSELSHILNPEQKELFTRLIVSSNKLNGYINNILNVAKFDQNRLEFSNEEIAISEIFEEISEDVSIRATSQNRNLEINIPHDLPTVNADLYGASEIFINLIDNAIKYSNDGGVIKVSAKAMGDFVQVSVKDFGIGIPENVLGNLFTKFYRSHRSREAVAGSGIGLYISKAIVETMGGRISVESVEGRGSKFTVLLPIFAKNINNQPTQKVIPIIKNHGKVI